MEHEETAKALLEIARSAIEAKLQGRHLTPQRQEPGKLAEPGGAFVTIRLAGELRGCIGRMESDEPLGATVARMASAAAFEDNRFPPLTQAEYPDVEIEVSVLSPMNDTTPEEIQVGVHGVLIEKGLNRGVFLPQVASQQGWDRATLLDNLCLKAGLPPGEYLTGAKLYSFTAEVFTEN